MKGVPFITEKKVMFRGVRTGTSKNTGKQYHQAIFMDGIEDLNFFVREENLKNMQALQPGKEYSVKIEMAGKFINLVGVA